MTAEIATSLLDRLLAEKGVLLADGATGTTLFKMGLTSGDAPELWNDIHPDRIRALHRSFVEAGADIVLTNSFGANRRRLALHGLENRVRELAEKAARLARAEADAAGRPVVVGGSVGPTGDLFAPLGPLSEAEAIDIFAEAMEGLKAGGIDVVWIETMSAPDEIRAAALAAERVGLPYVVTASFDTAGRTMMGLPPAGLGDLAATLPTPPAAVGGNCGVGASDLLVSVGALCAAHPEMVVVAKGNCGIPQFVGEEIRYSGTPETMGTYARLAVDSGARIVGGCCGTSPEHLAAMRRAIDGHVRRPAPTLECIEAEVGPLVAPPKPDGEGGSRRARRRG